MPPSETLQAGCCSKCCDAAAVLLLLSAEAETSPADPQPAQPGLRAPSVCSTPPMRLSLIALPA